jgi:phage shock protein A
MGVISRMSMVFKSKANNALDKVEDPRETLDYSYAKQLENLQKVRRSVADVATSRKRLELQLTQLATNAAKLDGQARQALAIGREDLAREALTRKQAMAGQIESLQAQHAQLQGQEERLVQTASTLQAQIESFRTRKETLKATYTAAQAQTKVNEAVAGISEDMADVGLAMQRAEDRVAEMQARAGAVDELLASGALADLSGTRDDLGAELARASALGGVELELAKLRGELGAGPAAAPPAALPAAQPYPQAYPQQAYPPAAAPAPAPAPQDTTTNGGQQQ